MQGSGVSYKYSGETTEWEDILIKKGITTKESVLLSKGLNPEDVRKRSFLVLIKLIFMKSLSKKIMKTMKSQPKLKSFKI
jgi:hypothetical protein